MGVTESNELTLCVDSSIKGVGLALVGGGPGKRELLWEKVDHSRYGSAGVLSQYLVEALSHCGVQLDEVRRMVVACGPGSFTGIKVGLAWCYGLAAPLRRPMQWLGVSALEEAAQQLAQSGDEPPGPVSLLLPSTATHGYLAQFDPQTASTRTGVVAITGDAQASEHLVRACQGSRIVLCAAWPMLSELFDEHAMDVTTLALRDVMGLALSGLVWRAKTAPASDFSATMPKPRYLRKSTAEEKLEAQ